MESLFLVISPEVVNELMEQGRQTANSFSNSWDFLFNASLNGRLFGEMVLLGRVLAAVAAAFAIAQLFQQMERGVLDVAFSRILSVMLALILLANSAALLKTFNLEARAFSRSIINDVQQSLVEDIDAHQAIKNIPSDIRISKVIQENVRLCLESDNEDLREQCLESVKADAEELASYLEEETGFRASAANRTIESIIETGSDTLMFIGSGISYFFDIEEPILWILAAIQEAFDWGVETAMLLSAMLSPVAVGLMVLNVQAIIAWFAGFSGFVVAKIVFAVMQAIISVLLIYADNVPAIAYGVFLAVTAPIISLIAAGLAGLGVFRVFGQYAPIVGTAVTYRGMSMFFQSFNFLTRKLAGRR